MIEEITLITEIGIGVYLVWWTTQRVEKKLDDLTDAVNLLSNHLTTIADNINILRVSKGAP